MTGNRSILHIRSSIEEARKQEAKTHSLERYIDSKIESMHHSINMPSEGQAQALVLFVTQYIEHVPDFIEALRELSQSAGIKEYIDSFLCIAENFFVDPPTLIEGHDGMQALIDEAYLAHRLMEEINDRIMLTCGVPLAPMDMTLSNLIIHDLLGEEFANELDLAVHYSVESLFEKDNFLKNQKFRSYLALHKAEGWTDTIEEWPCLAGESSIELILNTKTDKPSLH